MLRGGGLLPSEEHQGLLNILKQNQRASFKLRTRRGLCLALQSTRCTAFCEGLAGNELILPHTESACQTSPDVYLNSIFIDPVAAPRWPLPCSSRPVVEFRVWCVPPWPPLLGDCPFCYFSLSMHYYFDNCGNYAFDV